MVSRAGVGLIGALVAGLGAMLSGCTLITDSFLSNDFSGDPFPVAVDTTTGAIVVGMRQAGQPDSVAVLDLLSPVTATDPAPGEIPSVAYVDLTLLGEAGAGGPIDLPRAKFVETQVISVHPCPCDPADTLCATQCQIGAPGATIPFTSVLGANALAGDAIRLRLDADQIFVLPDIGGSDRGRTLSCDAVFGSPYRGGGTLVIDGTELPFNNLRITLQACLGPDPEEAKPQSLRGSDALLLVSTGIGISMLGETAYQRYVTAHPGAAELTALPASSVYLPSGLVSGRLANISAIALVAASSSNALAPCRQVYAHHLLAAEKIADEDCRSINNQPPARDCPCDNAAGFCNVPAVLELTPAAGVDVLVVSDDDPAMQALRTELRPDQQEVDGLLGVEALRAAEIDVDYPHDRLLARCPSGTCVARPQLATEGDRCQINSCIYGNRQQFGCSP